MTDDLSPTPVLLERDGGVAVVRLNRPDAMNALDLATKTALLETLRDVAHDESVRCVVLTGTGRAFCVGQDLKEHVRLLDSDPEFLATTVADHYNPVVELLSTMDKPVVAAVNGVAAGAGASFAFAADLRILAASGGFNTAFTGIALSCDSGASFALPRLIGTARAKELLLQPRTVPAAEALSLGLATEVVPDDEFEAHVTQVAQRLEDGSDSGYSGTRHWQFASFNTRTRAKIRGIALSK